jgi:hypothetical protein
MGRPISQNAATRQRLIERLRRRRVVVSLAGALGFFATVWLAGDYIAGSELGRTLDAKLAWLADPRTWLH